MQKKPKTNVMKEQQKQSNANQHEDYIQIMITPLVSSNSSVNIFLNENNLFTIKVHWDFAIFGTEKNPFIQGR